MRRKAWLLAGLVGLLLLLAWGPSLVQAQAEPTSQAPPGEPVVHVVQAGETLFGIAQQYGTTIEAIVAANDLTDPGLIAVDQELIIPASTGVVAPKEGEESSAPTYHTYVVLPGDTLTQVARRFDVTATVVAELNGLVNPADLPVGQALQVPGRQVGRLHPVAEKETALALALRYDLSPWGLLADNGLDRATGILPGQRLAVPAVVTTGTLPSPLLAVDLGPLPVVQGHTARLRVTLLPQSEMRGVLGDQSLSFAVEDGSHLALFGVHALADPGPYPLALLATDATGDEVYWRQAIEVVAGDYGYEEIILPPDRDALLDPEALAAERARIAEIKTVFTPERYWEGLFSRPIDTELTSFYGTRRLYQSPSYQYYGYHEGTDFDGEVGTPVYAPAAGVVVLAEPLYVRGNAVVIDHGWGVYTGYWHLSQIDVTVGQQVAPGDQIALVGDTGLSTGAHLHWDFWVNGINVSALQWTEQIFP